MTKYAIVTGSSSGIGQAICRLLLSGPDAGVPDCWEVYGISRRASEADAAGLSRSSSYHPVPCDLRDREAVAHRIRALRRQFRTDLLINNAGVGFFGPHEELSPDKIHDMIAVNLEAPLILTQLLLRDLKAARGTILNLSSVTALKTGNTHGCAYGATKAGLTSFGRSLFEEIRKYGVRVITLQPDLTESAFYDQAGFAPGTDPDTRLTAEEVARTAVWLLSVREGSVITELTISPLRHQIRRTPHLQ